MGPANLSNELSLPPVRDEILLRSKILIIDDEEVNVRLLQFRGFENVRSTTDSRVAIALFLDLKPDLILTDWLMPHLDGDLVVGQLRQFCCSTPI
jgi:CheY-like chemotaxis protein